MEKAVEIDTGQNNSKQCQKNPKAVALNILITVDKSKSSGNASKKCKQKVKVEQTTDALSEAGDPKKYASCNDGGGNQPNLSNQLPQYASIPNSEMLPCGCLIVYDRGSRDCNNAGVQCNNLKSSTQNKCSKGKSGGTCCSGCQPSGHEQDQYHCVRVKVKKKTCCHQTTAACQTPQPGIPETIQNNQVATQNVSVQAFQSEASVPPPVRSEPVPSEPARSAPSPSATAPSATAPSVPALRVPAPSVRSSTKCSRASMKASKQSTVAVSAKSTQVLMAPSSVKTRTSFRSVPPSAKSLQVAGTPVPSSENSSQVAAVPVPTSRTASQAEAAPVQLPRKSSLVVATPVQLPRKSSLVVATPVSTSRKSSVVEIPVMSSRKSSVVEIPVRTSRKSSIVEIPVVSSKKSSVTEIPLQSSRKQSQGATTITVSSTTRRQSKVTVIPGPSLRKQSQVVPPSANPSLCPVVPSLIKPLNVTQDPSSTTASHQILDYTEIPVNQTSVKQSEGVFGPIEDSKLVSTKATQNAFMPPPNTESYVDQTALQRLPMEESGVRIEGSSWGLGAASEYVVPTQASNADKDIASFPQTANEAVLSTAMIEMSYVEEISETPVGGVITEDCNGCNVSEPPMEDCAEEACEEVCEDVCEEEDACFSLNWSSWKKLDWESWDKFVSLMNGEPTCAPNLCMETCCCEEENAVGVYGACDEGNGWRNTFGGGECDSPCDGGELCMADPIGHETYALLLVLPLVFLGLMASFKTTC